jgi:HPt (histidine-containing phosphotransfer) domain-containing protein
MAGFTLEEVRETYSTDMADFVTSINDASGALLSAQALSLGIPRGENGNSLFEAIANCGHAIYGSSSLIDVQSMMQVARALEDMASRGHEALLQLEANVAKVRGLAALASDASEALRVMLDLELASKPEEAREVAASLLPRIATAVATLPPAPSPEDSAAESRRRPRRSSSTRSPDRAQGCVPRRSARVRGHLATAPAQPRAQAR